MSLAEEHIRAIKAQRAAERAAGGAAKAARARPGNGPAFGPNQPPGAPGGKKRPGPGRRWPLREWMSRETWAQLGSSSQAIFAWLCVRTDQKAKYWGQGYGPISRACGVSTDTVGRAVAQLEASGMVKTLTKTMPCKGQPRTRVMIWIQLPGEDLDLSRMDARLPAMGPEPQPCATASDQPGAGSTVGQICGTGGAS